MKIEKEVDPNLVPAYVAEFDAALHELEEVTNEIVKERINRNAGSLDGRDIAALIEAADRAYDQLGKIRDAFIDAKGRLIGIQVGELANRLAEGRA